MDNIRIQKACNGYIISKSYYSDDETYGKTYVFNTQEEVVDFLNAKFFKNKE